MLAGQLAKRPPVSVDAPTSLSANGQEARDKLLLVLKPDGQWFAEDSDEALTEDALTALVADLPEEGAEVRLLADAGITMTALRDRLETLQGLGVEQVRLVTRDDAAATDDTGIDTREQTEGEETP